MNQKDCYLHLFI